MNQIGGTVPDEISIRELIETIWSGKILIAVVTAAAVLISAIVSFFILPEKYQAQAVVTVTPIVIKVSTLQDSVSIVDYLATMPITTKANYVQQVKSTEVLENTIKKLDLKDASGNYISAGSLSSAITVTDVTTSNIFQITVAYGDPQKAQLIANTLCDSFTEYVAVSTKSQIQGVADLITQQLTNGEKVLIEKKQALQDYRTNNQSIDVLKGEITNLVNQIISYKSSLVLIETQIAADINNLTVLEAASESANIIPSTDYNLSIDLNKDPSAVGQNQVTIQPNNLSDSLLAINISSIQTRLVCNQSQKAELDIRIPELEELLPVKQALLTDSEYKFNSINSDMTVAQLNYAAYDQRNREVTTYNESDIGKTVIKVSSEALVGQLVSPNKKLNIAVAGVFGFCLSVFIVLFRNYWRRTKVSSPK